MKAFGLELRKHGTVDALYDDVDAILSSAGLQKRIGVTNDVKTGAIAHNLQKMLNPKSGYCSICDIEECADLAGIFLDGERLKVYHTLHCVHWTEMEEQFRNKIIAMILDDFREVLNPTEENEIIELQTT